MFFVWTPVCSISMRESGIREGNQTTLVIPQRGKADPSLFNFMNYARGIHGYTLILCLLSLCLGAPGVTHPACLLRTFCGFHVCCGCLAFTLSPGLSQIPP